MSRSTIRNLVIAFVMLVLVVGVVAGAFVKVLGKSQTLEEQIATLASKNQQEETLIRLQKIAQSSEPERAELASYFLSKESESIDFLNEVEALAPTVGVNLETNDLRQVTQDNRDWVEILFNASGRRSDLQNFIRILEGVPYSSRVTSVYMRGERNSNIWQANITIQVQILSYD